MEPKASDDVIVTGIRTGSIDQVVKALYHQYAGAVAAYIVGNGGSQQDADDVFQETLVAFIDLVRKDKYRGDAQVKTLLIGIGRNIWINEIKKKKSLDQRGAVYEKGKGLQEADGSDWLQERALRQRFHHLIGQLGDSCRTILTLFYYDNKSFREIVSETGYENEQVVRNKKYKCMKDLAVLIQQDPEAMEQVRLMYN